GSLVRRVRRLLGAPASHTGRGPAWLAASVALLLVAGITLGADGVRAVRAAAQDRTQIDPRPAVAATPAAPSTPPAITPVRAVTQTAAASPQQPSTPQAKLPPTATHAPTAEAQANAAIARVAESISTIASAEPALAPAAQRIRQHSSDDTHGNWMWSNNGEK